ncbi:MAG: transcriptional regulator [Mesoaciditoga sp.]|uniref:DegT/DnrJ/EryC1/StrS family aminotransferase n=1 Tax=Athalassotoga sp. TaxID=2022597 RepID=UPI000CC6592D|nr:MAG: transcriptional regulator [Mesoaciditoga sp.]HEU24517.1 DegT/DnrJ/EryC1/StrS family aminotransferase [Mesoaciditoga lauensis]
MEADTVKIPLFDLTRQYKELRNEMIKKIDETISSGVVIMGQNVEEIEERIANYIGVKHAVAVGNGSDALVLALQSMGIGKGDKVITTPYTFFSTASAITRLGGIPIFVDVGEDFNINVDLVEKKIKSDKSIKAVIPVHLFGKSVNMEYLKSVCDRYGVKILEDAAQSIGSEVSVGGKRVKTASIGDAGILSFFPTKNLGAYGDAGMVLTNSDEIADKVKILRVHGSHQKYVHEEIGYNSRMDEMQAAILNVKFPHLDEWIDKRINAASKYSELLGDAVVCPAVPKDRTHVFHQYVVRTERREELREYLTNEGVGTAIYYPIPLHLQQCFSFLNYKPGDFPVAEKLSKESLAIPMFPEITFEEQKYVANTIKKFMEERS